MERKNNEVFNNGKNKEKFVKPSKKGIFNTIKRNVKDSKNGLKILFKESGTVHKIYPLYIGGTIVLGIIAGFTPLDYLVCAFVLILDLVTETLNSAIEELGDKASQVYDNRVKRAKDLSSAAVYLMHLLLIAVILLLFIGRLASQYQSLGWWPVIFY